MRTALLTCLLLQSCQCGPVEDSQGDSGEARSPTQAAGWQLHDELESLVLVHWEQSRAATTWVEYGLEGEDWMSSPARELQAGSQKQWLAGLPYGAELDFQVVSEDNRGRWELPGEAITGELPASIPLPELILGDAGTWDGATAFFLTSLTEAEPAQRGMGAWTVILDRQARIVWALQSPAFRSTNHPLPSLDGTRLLLDHSSFWLGFDEGAASQVQAITLDGDLRATHDTPGLHHAFAELDDGSLLWASWDGDDETIERLSGGEQSRLWSCRAFLDEISGDGRCGSNTIQWDQNRDSLLVSLFYMHSVVELDRSTGQELRWFGHLPGAWVFEPEDGDFWHQHGALYTDTGTMIMSCQATQDAEETIVREYALDDGSLSLSWSFGDDEGIWAEALGGALRLANGDTLHYFGTGNRIREISPEGQVVWDVSIPDADFTGRVTPLPDLFSLLP